MIYKTKVFRRDILVPNSEPSQNALIEVRPIHSGNLKVTLSNTINLNHPACSGMKDKEITVPIFAYLLHHEKYGYFLINSGCESSLRAYEGIIISKSNGSNRAETK